MKEFRMRAFFGILGLAGAGFMISSVSSVGGCSSSNGGSTGTAGSSSTGTAGTTGQAGTTGNGGNNSGGSGGGGGASQPASGCAVSDLPPPPAPLIADFASVDGGASIPIGGTFAYASPDGVAVKPTATVTNGGWHITLTAPGLATDPQYVGVGIYFNGNANGTDCVDATQYTGIKFDVSGSIMGTGCTAQYSTNDSAHSAASATDPKAGGPAGSYAPQKALTVSSTVTTVMMPFAGADAPSGGSPATGIDKAKLTGAQWQFSIAAGTTNACMVDLIIDNVSFY